MGKLDLQSFGGSWTDKKLAVLRGYLSAYTKALQNTSFRTLYIDAFAGTGYRQLPTGPYGATTLFKELLAEEPQRFLAGSARIALETDPAFDEFVFVEADPTRAEELSKLCDKFPDRKTEVREGDANDHIQKLCRLLNWRECRAVLFLDPFGMQVDWTTMKAIATTKAIDTWILFPLGIGVNRLLTRRLEDIPLAWRTRLDRVFGTAEWKNKFYNKSRFRSGFFPELSSGSELKQATFESIGQFYHSQLKTIFPSVAPNPKNLLNSTNNPIFQLHFAAGNPRGGPIALKIAKHLLDKV